MVEGGARSDPAIRFGVVEIDIALRQVRRTGIVVAAEPKPFELLLYLIRHRDRVVRRDELMNALWPGVVVSEATLSSAVRRVRDVIGPERARIRVVPKVGYRFLAADDDELVGESERPDIHRPSILPASYNDSDSQQPFVGRATEMERLTKCLAEGLRGAGRLVTVFGEPGAGKSRIVSELAHHAKERGAEVLFGRCYEGEGGQVLWPWVQLFRSFAASRTDAQLATLLGAEASDISRLTAAVPAPDTESPASDPAVQRARLLDSVVAVLRRASQQSPLLIAFDDLHWADSATVMLLRALVDQVEDVPIVVIGSYRSLEIDASHPLAAALATMRCQPSYREVALAGLSREEVAALLTRMAGGAVDPAVTTAVFDATEGNPLFVREYWQDLTEEGSVVRAGDSWIWRCERPQLSIPMTVSEIIRRRLHRLQPDTIQLLAIAAVIGREFGHGVLATVTPSPSADVIDCLDQAMTAGVIEEVAGSLGHYRFTHAVIRETLYDGLTGLRRAALHRAVGEALERTAPEAPSPHLIAELAHHFLAAIPAGAVDPAIDYAMRAADEAMRSYAYDDAVRYLEQAVRLSDLRGDAGNPSDALRRCERQLELADALRSAGEGTAMRAAYEEAARRARAIPAPVLFARAAIGVTSRWIPEDEPAIRLLEEALTVLPDADLALRALTKARLAKTLYLFPETRTQREQLCADARRLATESRDFPVLAEVLADSLEALFHGDSLPQQDMLANALHEAATSAGDTRLRLLSGAWQIVNAMRHGRLCDAEQRLVEFHHLATSLRQRRFLHHAAAFDAALLMARGRLEHAERRMKEALTLGVRIDEASARWLHWAQISHLRREQGRLQEFLGEGLALRLPPGTPAALFYERSFEWATPHVFSELGREADVRASFAALMAQGLDRLPAENARNTRIPALLSLGDACATIGDEPSAAQLSAALSPYADQWQVIGWGSVVFTSVHTMLGALAAVRKKWSTAEEHFQEALRQHERENAVCAQTRALYQYARAVLRRGRRADLARAQRLIARGLDLAHAHGLHGVANRLKRLSAND